MSRRRDNDMPFLFCFLPWWGYATLAALVYLAAQCILPNWKIDVLFLTDLPGNLSPVVKGLAVLPLIMALLTFCQEYLPTIFAVIKRWIGRSSSSS